MPTPKQGYWLDGKRLVSTTTPLYPYHPDGIEGLVNWAVAHKLAGRDPDAERDRAADIGTMAHAAVELWCQGGEYIFAGDPEIAKPASMAYSGFRSWIDNSRFKITHTEVRLMSKKYGYGGTLDASGLSHNGLRGLLDWKTSNYTKGTMLWQLAAYRNLWNENFPEDPINGGVHLLRFDKRTGSFTHQWHDDLDNEFEGFLHLKGAYECYKITKRKMG